MTNMTTILFIIIGAALFYLVRYWKPQTAKEEQARIRFWWTLGIFAAVLLVWLYWSLPWWVIAICGGITVLLTARIVIGTRH